MKRAAWLFNESEPLPTKPAPFSQLRSFRFSISIRARSTCASYYSAPKFGFFRYEEATSGRYSFRVRACARVKVRRCTYVCVVRMHVCKYVCTHVCIYIDRSQCSISGAKYIFDRRIERTNGQFALR